jgi:hypothetical protein
MPIYGNLWRFGFSLAYTILNQQLRIAEIGRNRGYMKPICRTTNNATGSFASFAFGYRWITLSFVPCESISLCLFCDSWIT